jgi:transcription-repair coupling factor (superfamily II helicase)
MTAATALRTTSHAEAPRRELPIPDSEGALAIRLIEMARETRETGLVHVAGSEGRAKRLAHLIWALAPDFETTIYPAWDCLPFDRTSPSAKVMGRRMAALATLARPATRPRIVLTLPDALLQRVPPREAWSDAGFELKLGDTVDLAKLATAVERIGYAADERVDEPGEFALRGQVLDIFPAGYYLPVRIDHEEGRVTGISSYDAASQRKTDAFEALVLRPTSEVILHPGEDGEIAERAPGIEHRLSEFYPRVETLFDYLPDATFEFEPRAVDRRAAFLEQVVDAHESRIRLDRSGGRPPSPDRLYLDAAEAERRLAAHTVIHLVETPDADAPDEVPHFAVEARPDERLSTFVAEARGAGRRVVLAAPSNEDLARLTRRIARVLGDTPAPAADWAAIEAADPGSLLAMTLPLERGFAAPDAAATFIAAADILGSRTRTAGDGRSGLIDDEEFRIGDAVIHLEHGVGVLHGLETVETQPGRATDTLRLGYAGDAILMAPVDQIDLMWRYGAVAEGVTLDRLDGESWPKRRAKVEAEINVAAAELARLAEERRKVIAPKLAPPRRAYERFVARFPYTETRDQHDAVQAILADLTSGRLMDRLVCGDVGFGKTEVALRAAAAAALAGKQVAIVAPTTVLVRQHLQTFQTRFADLGIEVGHLSRLVKPAEAKQVKAGLAEGRIRVVIGTHALAGKGVSFADLGLLIVDEEQRFGAAIKEKLRALGDATHVLTLTATPIPRTLQAALVGLQDVSVLATPPSERKPVRTFVTALDEVTMREALLRERRRGGQSFVVCPRIEDIEPMAQRLKALVPELDVSVAHGKLPAEEIDETMVRFAAGDGDVLLATNIIESGLDVPRANTIMVWHADRFGLSQLHQLRGRVGRSRARGIAYLLTDPETEIPAPTRKRLETLETLDRLGAGFAISAEDLEQRGAGDLLGDTQAGHVKLIGSGLYRRLLERALIVARGETPPEEWTPELNIGVSGRIPPDYIPEDEVRVNLYARIARQAVGNGSMTAEIEDRFGPLPEELANLITLTHLKKRCRDLGIIRMDAGPQAIALTFKERKHGEAAFRKAGGKLPLEWRGDRLVLPQESDDSGRLEAVRKLVDALGTA